MAARLNASRDFSFPFGIPISAALSEVARRAAGHPFADPLLGLLARVAHLDRLPANALIHGEINEANARRRDDGTIVLVDWDEAGVATSALEYGYPLITVFLSEVDLTFDDRSARGFYEGYTEAGGVLDPRLAFEAALFHALRYMWWGDVSQRWERIVYACRREHEICSVVR